MSHRNFPRKEIQVTSHHWGIPEDIWSVGTEERLPSDRDGMYEYYYTRNPCVAAMFQNDLLVKFTREPSKISEKINPVHNWDSNPEPYNHGERHTISPCLLNKSSEGILCGVHFVGKDGISGVFCPSRTATRMSLRSPRMNGRGGCFFLSPWLLRDIQVI